MLTRILSLIRLHLPAAPAAAAVANTRRPVSRQGTSPLSSNSIGSFPRVRWHGSGRHAREWCVSSQSLLAVAVRMVRGFRKIRTKSGVTFASITRTRVQLKYNCGSFCSTYWRYAQYSSVTWHYVNNLDRWIPQLYPVGGVERRIPHDRSGWGGPIMGRAEEQTKYELWQAFTSVEVSFYW